MSVRSYCCNRVHADTKDAAAGKALARHPGANWWEYIALLDEVGDAADGRGGDLAL